MAQPKNGGVGFGAELAGSMPEPSAMADDLIDQAVQDSAAAAAAEGPVNLGFDGAPAPDPAMAATDAAELVFATLPALLGPEWEPTPDERARCERAMRRYFEKYGAWDLPPGLALVAAFGIYAAKRSRFGFDRVFAMLGMGPAAAASEPIAETAPLNFEPELHGKAA